MSLIGEEMDLSSIESNSPILVLLSGPTSVGKSSLAHELIDKKRFRRLRTGEYLAAKARQRGAPINRTVLQQMGDELDLQTDYAWVVEDVARPAIRESNVDGRWLLDSVRKARQVERLRGEFNEAVFHVHLFAPEEVLRERYERRRRSGGDYSDDVPYDGASRHPNELAARDLLNIAELIIDVSNVEPEVAIEAILRRERGRLP